MVPSKVYAFTLTPEFHFLFATPLAINHAVSPTDRWQSSQMALHAFSHSNVELHDYEMSLGADKALCLKVGYAVVTNSKPEQIVLLC